MCLLQQALLAPLHRNGKLYGPAFSQQAKRQCHTSQEHQVSTVIEHKDLSAYATCSLPVVRRQMLAAHPAS